MCIVQRNAEPYSNAFAPIQEPTVDLGQPLVGSCLFHGWLKSLLHRQRESGLIIAVLETASKYIMAMVALRSKAVRTDS